MFIQAEKFRKERGLEHSCGDLVGNLGEEAQELLKAIYTNDKYEIVDALCDHVVFIINGLEAMGHDAKSHIVVVHDMTHCTPTTTASRIYNGIGHYLVNRDISTLAFIANECLATIEAMGYCAHSCMLETLKEVNSRDGAHNAELGKWCKFKDEVSMAKWYEADYEACKR